ncbi:MAG: VCBS repeat-containing protein, partial [Saprospiraceae bacterium]|nr:VCBS repeat-containing protein [Saprospiraceae bacterium]
MKKGAGVGLLLLVLGQCPGFGQPAYWFADISRTAGVANPGKNRGVAIADYDGDGREDVYVSVWEGANRLYRNLDGLRFEER